VRIHDNVGPNQNTLWGFMRSKGQISQERLRLLN